MLLFIAGFAMLVAVSYRGFTPLKTLIFIGWLVTVLMAIGSNDAFITLPLTAGAMGAIIALVVKENRKRRQ